jgi:hypothetical protein
MAIADIGSCARIRCPLYETHGTLANSGEIGTQASGLSIFLFTRSIVRGSTSGRMIFVILLWVFDFITLAKACLFKSFSLGTDFDNLLELIDTCHRQSCDDVVWHHPPEVHRYVILRCYQRRFWPYLEEAWFSRGGGVNAPYYPPCFGSRDVGVFMVESQATRIQIPCRPANPPRSAQQGLLGVAGLWRTSVHWQSGFGIWS